MKKTFQTFLALTLSFLSFMQTPAFAQQRENIVLLPIEVSPEYQLQKDVIGAEIQKSLSKNFNVFYGEAVEQALEQEYKKEDCTAESCVQNVAILFNGEIVVDASLQAIGNDSYLTMRFLNVLTGELEAIKNEVCEACSAPDLVRFVGDVAGDVQLKSSDGLSALLEQQKQEDKEKPEIASRKSKGAVEKSPSYWRWGLGALVLAAGGGGGGGGGGNLDTSQPDSDGDGTLDVNDAFPNDPSEQSDSDNDGVGDNADVWQNDDRRSLDSDGDGIDDSRDPFPNDPAVATTLPNTFTVYTTNDAIFSSGARTKLSNADDRGAVFHAIDTQVEDGEYQVGPTNDYAFIKYTGSADLDVIVGDDQTNLDYMMIGLHNGGDYDYSATFDVLNVDAINLDVDDSGGRNIAFSRWRELDLDNYNNGSVDEKVFFGMKFEQGAALQNSYFGTLGLRRSFVDSPYANYENYDARYEWEYYFIHDGIRESNINNVNLSETFTGISTGVYVDATSGLGNEGIKYTSSDVSISFSGGNTMSFTSSDTVTFDGFNDNAEPLAETAAPFLNFSVTGTHGGSGSSHFNIDSGIVFSDVQSPLASEDVQEIRVYPYSGGSELLGSWSINSRGPIGTRRHGRSYGASFGAD